MLNIYSHLEADLMIYDKCRRSLEVFFLAFSNSLSFSSSSSLVSFFFLSLALFVPGNKRRREGKGEEEEEEEEEVNALICMRVVSSAVGK